LEAERPAQSAAARRERRGQRGQCGDSEHRGEGDVEKIAAMREAPKTGQGLIVVGAKPTL
jgi:hypothetical protein